MFIPTIAVTDDVMHRRVSSVIRLATERAYGSINKACIDMDVKQPHFNSALDGERGLPVGFLSLSKAFWAWFAVGLAEEFGIPKAVRRGARLMWVAVQRKRMAKVALRASARRVA